MPGTRLESANLPAVVLALAAPALAVLGGAWILLGNPFVGALACGCAGILYLLHSHLDRTEVSWIRLTTALGTSVLFLVAASRALPGRGIYAFGAGAAWWPVIAAGMLAGGAVPALTDRGDRAPGTFLAAGAAVLILIHLARLMPGFMTGGWLAACALLPVASFLAFRLGGGDSSGSGPLGHLNLTAKVVWTSAAGLFLAVIILKSAWIGDDAFISFRTVENLLHGSGLTWNAGERVQTFTHPLWLVFLVLGRLVSGEPYYSSLALGLGFSVLAVLLIALKMGRNPVAVVLAVLAAGFSKAFVDYATSGLENPLAYLLTVLFLAEWFHRRNTAASLLRQSLLAALITFTRMDLFLLLAPALAVSMARAYGRDGLRIWRPVLAGWAPFILWELFSLAYYGFPFPNTAYAKLGSGVSPATLFHQGFLFLLDSFWRDPVTPAVILCAMLLPVAGSIRKNGPPALGLLLYLLYIVWIGGDFMSGRFLAVPFIMGLAVVIRARAWNARTGVGVWVLLALFSTLLPQNPWAAGADYAEQPRVHGIADERGFYFPATGLLRARPGHPYGNVPDHPFTAWMKLGSRTRTRGGKAVVHGAVGVLGYTAGPGVYVIDMMGLGDPLLARLPAVQGKDIRIGHFRRKIPGGYYDLHTGGTDRLLSSRLDAYYRALREVITGPVFSVARMKTAFALNTGRLDHLVPRPYFRTDRFTFSVPAGSGTPYDNLLRAGFSAAADWEYADALGSFEAAIRNQPRRPAAYLGAGLVCQQRGQMTQALAEFRRAAALDPRAQRLEEKVEADIREEAGS